DACYAAFSVAELRVKGCGLDLEFLNDVGGRNVGGDDLVAVGPCGAGRAVDSEITPVGAGSADRESDYMGWLEWAIESLIARERHPGRESDHCVGIAVHQRQLGDSTSIYGLAHRSMRPILLRGVSGNRNLL